MKLGEVGPGWLRMARAIGGGISVLVFLVSLGQLQFGYAFLGGDWHHGVEWRSAGQKPSNDWSFQVFFTCAVDISDSCGSKCPCWIIVVSILQILIV